MVMNAHTIHVVFAHSTNNIVELVFHLDCIVTGEKLKPALSSRDLHPLSLDRACESITHAALKASCGYDS